MSGSEENHASISSSLRHLPGLNEVLSLSSVARLSQQYSLELTTRVARRVLDELRHKVRRGDLLESELTSRLQALPLAIERDLESCSRPRLSRVINATGVILQTNLGRAPLSEEAMQQVVDVARGYCSLEYDVDQAQRSYRDGNVDQLVLEVLRSKGVLPETSAGNGQHGVAVVNNCAAATVLALNTLAEGGEVIVSRGELVEIGGGFRIPDILAKSGAVLREVGTTNKTRLGDYAAAINPGTRLILRVHQSNFRIEGFTEQPSLGNLIALAKERGIPLFDDQGTGCILNLEEVALHGQASWLASVASGAPLIASSGDKLLGGPQCGLLVGDFGLVERLRANPLYRALRVDKLTYAALDATLRAYLHGKEESLPVVRMIRLAASEVRARCEKFVTSLMGKSLEARVVAVESVVGGGTTPGTVLPSFAVALRMSGMSAHTFAAALRGCQPAIITRIRDEQVLLDLRTVAPWEDEELQQLVQRAMPGERHA